MLCIWMLYCRTTTYCCRVCMCASTPVRLCLSSPGVSLGASSAFQDPDLAVGTRGRLCGALGPEDAHTHLQSIAYSLPLQPPVVYR